MARADAWRTTGVTHMTRGIARAGGPRVRVVHSVKDADAAYGERARRVATENWSAATLPREDARVIFAQNVAAQLQGGPAALLTPERRRALMVRAHAAGLRDFDANLIIAIVQDRARDHAAAGLDQDARLTLVRPAAELSRGAGWWPVLCAAVLALVGAAAVIAWIAGGR